MAEKQLDLGAIRLLNPILKLEWDLEHENDLQRKCFPTMICLTIPPNLYLANAVPFGGLISASW